MVSTLTSGLRVRSSSINSAVAPGASNPSRTTSESAIDPKCSVTAPIGPSGLRSRAQALSTAVAIESTSSPVPPRGTHQTPPVMALAPAPATACANRLLPTPGSPTTVTSRSVSSEFPTAVSSSRRPMKEVIGVGRLPAADVPAFSGGNSARRSGWVSCQMRVRPSRPRKPYRPRSVASAASGSASRTACTVWSESRICPPNPHERMRAHRMMVSPT